MDIQSYNRTATRVILFSFILIFPLFFISCSEKTIDHDKFIDAYIDLRIAQDTLTQDSVNIQTLKAIILKKHGMTEKEYNAAFNYFNKDPELWNEFYDTVIARVDSLRKIKRK
jgi:hypothetical protein